MNRRGFFAALAGACAGLLGWRPAWYASRVSDPGDWDYRSRPGKWPPANARYIGRGCETLDYEPGTAYYGPGGLWVVQADRTHKLLHTWDEPIDFDSF